MLVVTVVLVVAIQYFLNKYLNAMLLSKLVPFMQKWEGGLSRKTSDTASNNPAPWTYQGVTGWHTNKGITYTTFINNAARLGYAPTADNFFKMPDELWLKILEGTYMAAYPLQKIAHLPRIQAVIITWAWGSGVGGSEGYLADFQREEMGINDTNITPTEIVDNFRKRITPLNEKIWFEKLNKRRADDFSHMGTYAQNKNGWLNRLNDFSKTFA